MSALENASAFLTSEEYLAGEELAAERHEYLNGVVYAMAGTTETHAAIVTNGLISLGTQLRGKPCRPYSTDLKLRVTHGTDERFYYPDLMVVCNPRRGAAVWQDAPVVLVEVLSESTQRVDLEEKRVAYLRIATLEAYVVVSQWEPEVLVYRRAGDGWKPETLQGLDKVLELVYIGCCLPLAELYEEVRFDNRTAGSQP